MLVSEKEYVLFFFPSFQNLILYLSRSLVSLWLALIEMRTCTTWELTEDVIQKSDVLDCGKAGAHQLKPSRLHVYVYISYLTNPVQKNS
jgi:hypothetical protein